MDKRRPKRIENVPVDGTLYKLPVEYATVVRGTTDADGLSDASMEAVRRFARIYRPWRYN
ncbi:MAG: hypothetical protein K2J97_00915 [Muribaculaceae bacterium]|nr:hypothetical protein [Muribaculaceae bacterium]